MALGASLVRGFTRFPAAKTAVAAAFAVLMTAAGGVPAEAEQRAPPRIDSFGPYKVGMPLDDAKKADPNAKQGACGELAEDRQCLIVKAAVFEEPAVIYAVLDENRERVDKVIAKLDPKLSRRRAYRCIRLSEKVFALLVVVYGPKYKQQYDANKRPLPAVAWDGELEGRLIFRANCKTQDEGTPLITVIPRKGEGRSVAADLSPTPTPDKGGKSAAELLQGQRPDSPGTARADAVSALAEAAKNVEQQVRRAAPAIQEPPAQQTEPGDPIILGAGPGGLSIDSAPIVPQPAPTGSQIDIDDPSFLPRAAPRTPVDVTLLPDATPPASAPSPEPAVPPKPASPPAVVASKPAAPIVAPPQVKAEPSQAAGSGQGAAAKIDIASKSASTPPQAAPAPLKPGAVARVSPTVPISRTTPGPAAGSIPGAGIGNEGEADRSVAVDTDDDDGEQAEPVREMPVFAQSGTTPRPVAPIDQGNRTGTAAVQAPGIATPTPLQSPAATPPRDPASPAASAAIPKSPKAPPPATGRPRSLIATRDSARQAADHTPGTEAAEKPRAAIPLVEAVPPAAAAPVQQPSGTAVDLPDLDDESTGTVTVSADRAAGRSTNPTRPAAPVVVATPNPPEQRVASGQPRRLTRDAVPSPDRADLATPPTTGARVPAPSVTPIQPEQGASGPPRIAAPGRPAGPGPVQTATVPNRPAPATPPRSPSSAPVSRLMPDGVENFGYDLDLRTERQKSRWKAPVPPARPWRTLDASSLPSGAVSGGVADTTVLDEPGVALAPVKAETRVTATGAASDGADVEIGLANPETPKAMDPEIDVIEQPAANRRGRSKPDAFTGTSVLDEPLVSDATGVADRAPESREASPSMQQPADVNPPEKPAPVPPKRPWDTLTDEVFATYVTPVPVPAARPHPASGSEPHQGHREGPAEQPDGIIVDIGSSPTSGPDVDGKSFGRRTDSFEHL